MQQKQPIGIFDSGVGGLNLWKPIRELLPQENTIYIADNAFSPYGKRSKDEIISRTFQVVESLIKKECKLIVVACNTATTNAIDKLREKFDLPFVGIEPALKPAALQSQTKTIGVLATQGTLSSKLFEKTSHAHAQGIKVVEQIGTGLVTAIEENGLETPALKTLLSNHLKPMLEQNIDRLVLGCTHYPYLVPLLEELLPPQVVVVDNSMAIAKQTQYLLEKNKLQNPAQNSKGEHLFYCTGHEAQLKAFLPKGTPVEQLRVGQ